MSNTDIFSITNWSTQHWQLRYTVRTTQKTTVSALARSLHVPPLLWLQVPACNFQPALNILLFDSIHFNALCLKIFLSPLLSPTNQPWFRLSSGPKAPQPTSQLHIALPAAADAPAHQTLYEYIKFCSVFMEEKSVHSRSCSHTSPICGFPTFVQSCKHRLVFQHTVYLSKRRKAFTLDRSYSTNTANLNAMCQYLQRCLIIWHRQSCLHTSVEQTGADNSLHTVIFNAAVGISGNHFLLRTFGSWGQTERCRYQGGSAPPSEAAGLTVKVQHLLWLQQNTAEWLIVVFHIQIH